MDMLLFLSVPDRICGRRIAIVPSQSLPKDFLIVALSALKDEIGAKEKNAQQKYSNICLNMRSMNR
jgi:hypothetical protein